MGTERFIRRERVSLVLTVLLLAGAALPLTAQSAGWYSPDWPVRQRITISQNAAAANLSGFPLLVNITDGGNPLFGAAREDGRDILFTAADGVTRIPHEIERYLPSGGSEELVAWVRVPTLFSAADTVIYMYYGNSGAPAQQDPQAVWDDGFEVVMHLNEMVPNGEIGNLHFDSTANQYIGTQYRNQGVAAGRAGGAQRFQRAGGDPTIAPETIELGNIYTDDWTAITLEAWIRRDAVADSRVINKAFGTTATQSVFMIGIGPAADQMRIRMNTDEGPLTIDPTILPTPNDPSQWLHIAWSWSAASNEVRAYVNGVPSGTWGRTGSSLWDIENTNDEPGVFISNFTGEPGQPQRTFPGDIDEVRISRVARSAAWMAATYRNISNPAADMPPANFQEQVAVGGTVFASEGGTVVGAGRTVRLAVNGDSGYTATAQTNSSGGYFIPIPSDQVTSGDQIIVFLDGAVEKAATVTLTDGGNLTGIDLFGNRLTLRSETSATLNNADLVAARYSSADVLYTTGAGNAVTVAADRTLHVPPGHTFTQTGNITVGGTGNLRLRGTFNASATGQALSVGGSVSGSGVMNGNTAAVTVSGSMLVANYSATSGLTSVAGNWSVENFSHNTSTVRFAGTGSVAAAEFFNLQLDGGVRSAAGNLIVSNALALTSGTFAPGDYTHQIAGNWNDAGITFAATAGTIVLTSAAPEITAAGANRFFNLTLQDGAALQSDIYVRGRLRIGAGQLSAGARLIRIEGDWENPGGATGFDGGTGEVRFVNPARTSTISGSTTFHSFSVPTTAQGKSLFFTAGTTQTVGGALDIRGVHDESYVGLQSTVVGQQWSIDASAASSIDLVALIVQDSNAVSLLTATNSYDGGNNTNWAFDNSGDRIWTWVGLHSGEYSGGEAGRNWFGTDDQGGVYPRYMHPERTGPNGSTRTYVPAAITQDLVNAYNSQYSADEPPPTKTLSDRRAIPLMSADVEHQSVTVNSGAVIDTNGFRLNPDVLTNLGTILRHTGTTFRATPDSGTVLYYNNSGGNNIQAHDYYNLHLARPEGGAAIIYTLGADRVVNNNLVLGPATFFAGALSERSFDGANFNLNTRVLTVARNATIGSGLTLNASTAGATGLSVAGDLSGAGTLQWNQTNVSVGGDLAVGTLLTPTAARSLSVGGNWAVGSFAPDFNATLIFSGPGSVTAATFYNLTLAADSGTRTALGNIQVNGDLVINAGATLDMNDYALSVTGNISGAGTLIGGSTVTVGGNMAAADYIAAPLTTVGGNWNVSGEFDAGEGEVRFTGVASQLQGFAAFYDLIITAGASLDTLGNSIGIAGLFSNQGTLRRRGSEFVQQTDATQGAVRYYGAGPIVVQTYAGSDYYDLVLDGDAQATAISFDGDIEILNDFRFLRGTVSAGDRFIRIAGNWEKGVGTTTFLQQTSTVEFFDQDKTTAYSGRTFFYRLWIRTPGKRVEFTPGLPDHRAAVANQFVVRGSSASPVQLHSTINGTQWRLNVDQGATYDVEYASVRDSNANGDPGTDFPQTVTARSSTSVANNDNWTFTGVVRYWQGTDQDYQVANNWNPDGVPGPNDTVIIQPGFPVPRLDQNRSHRNLIVQPGATIDLQEFSLTLSGQLTNGGTIRRHLVPSQGAVRLNRTDTTSGTTVYYNGTGFVQDYGSTDYHNLVIDGVTVSLGYALGVAGNLTINAGATLNAQGKALTLGGNWTRLGTFNAAGAPLTLVNPDRISTLGGGGTFGSLTVTSPGKTVRFQDGLANKTIVGSLDVRGSLTQAVVLESSNPGNRWFIDVAPADADVEFATISDSHANEGTANEIQPQNSTDGTNNINWIFGPNILFRVWTGAAAPDSSWNTAANWEGNLVPGIDSEVVIPDVSGGSNNFPVLDSAVSIRELHIEAGASLDTVGHTLTIEDAFTNQGTLFRRGGDSVSRMDTVSGTVHYLGTAGSVQRYTDQDRDYNNLVLDGATYTISGPLGMRGNLSGSGTLQGGTVAVSVDGHFAIENYSATTATTTVGGNWTVDNFSNNGGLVSFDGDGSVVLGPFWNLRVAGGIRTVSGDITVQNNLTIQSAGTLLGGSFEISVAANWTNNGAFSSQTGTVRLFNSAKESVLLGSSTFYRLVSVTGGKTIRFQSGQTQSVSNELLLQGSSGNLLHLRPTSSGVQWNLALDIAAEQDVRFVSVRYSNASEETVFAPASEDLGDNINWNFTEQIFPRTWQGGAPGAERDWFEADNWLPEGAPSEANSVTVPDGRDFYPQLTANVAEIAGLIIEAEAELDLDQWNITVSGQFSNAGILRLFGETGQILAGISVSTSEGSVEYNGPESYSGLRLGSVYFNLVFSGSGSYQLGAALSVSGSLTVSNGTLDLDTHTATIAAGISSSGGGTTVDFGSGTTTVSAGGVNLAAGSARFAGQLAADGQTIDIAAALRLDGDAVISTTPTGGAITIGGSVDGQTGQQHSLTIDAGAAAVTLGGTIGGVDAPGSLAISGVGAGVALPQITLAGGSDLSITVAGAVTQGGPLLIPGATTIDPAAGGTITLGNAANELSGAIEVPRAAAVEISNNRATLLGNIGDTAPLAGGFTLSSAGAVSREATTAIITDAQNVAITAGGSVGSDPTPIAISVSTLTVDTAPAAGDVFISAAGNVGIGSITAGGGAVSVTAGGAISDAAETQAVNIAAGSITLSAQSIGAGGVDQELDVELGSGVLDLVSSAADGAGNIYLAETASTLETSRVALATDGATSQTVVLYNRGEGFVIDSPAWPGAGAGNDTIQLRAVGSGAEAGDITFIDGSIVVTGDVVLQSAGGAISRSGDPGDVTAALLTLQAAGDIGAEPAAERLQTEVATLDFTAGGDVYITEADAISVGGQTTAANGLVDIETTAGTLTVGAAVTAGGAGGVRLAAADGISLSADVSTTGDVSLTAAAAIARTAGVISADTLTLAAGSTIGAAAAVERLQTEVADLSFSAGGNVYLTEADAVSVGGQTTAANGLVDIETTAGTLTVGAAVTADGAGGVRLAAAGAGSAVVVSDAVSSGTGLIELTAADGVSLAANVNTAGTVALAAGAAIARTAGVISADTLTLAAGSTIGAAAAVERLQTEVADLSFTAGGNVYLTEADAISVGGQTTAANGLIDIETTAGTLTVGAALAADGAGGVRLAAAGAGSAVVVAGTVSSGSGLIGLAAADGISLAADVNTTGDVSLTAAAAIARTAGVISADTLVVAAGSGIGADVAGQRLEAAVSALDAENGNGGIYISNSAPAAVEISRLVVSGGAGELSYQQSGGEAVTLLDVATVDGDIAVSNSGAGADVLVGLVTAEGAGRSVSIIAGGSIDDATVAGDALVDIEAATIALVAGADGAASIGALNGALDIETGGLSAQTSSGSISIDSYAAGALSISALEALGDISLSHVGDLSIDGAVTSGDGMTPGGSIVIAAGGALSVEAPVSSDSGAGGVLTLEGVTLEALASISVGAGDIALSGVGPDLVVSSAVTIPGALVLRAPRDVIIAAAVQSSAAGVTLTADVNNSGIGGVRILTAGRVEAAAAVSIAGSDLFATLGPLDLIEIQSDGATAQVAGGTTVTIEPRPSAPAGAQALINGRVSAAGALSITANDSVLFGVDGDLDSAAGPVTVTAAADGSGGAITMANGAVINAGNGTIELSADDTVTLGGLRTTSAAAPAVEVGSNSAAIVSAGIAHSAIEADTAGATVRLRAAAGIGTAADPLNTSIAGLDAESGAGPIVIAESTALTVSRALTSGGLIRIGTGGDLRVEAGGVATDGPGAVELSAPVGGARIVIDAAISSVNGNVTLDAGAAPGDRIDLGADITTGGGSIALESAVELTGDVVLDTGPGAGNVILAAAVDAAIADAQGLEVISGNGLISFGGLIGGANRLAFLRLDSAAQGFNMPQLSVALDLRLFAGGPVTQTGPLTGASVHVKTRGAVGAAITLTDENNNFGTVTLEARNAADGADAAGAISYRDTAGFTLGALGFGAAGIRTTAQAVLQSADAVNQAGAVIAAGLDLRGSGPYALGGAGNRVSALAADVTSNVVFTNQDQPLGLSAMIIGGNLEIRANGVNDSGPLAVQGTAFFDGRGDGVTLNGEGADANQFDGSVTLADGATGITLANNTFADAVTVSGAPTTLNAPPAVQPFVELIIGAAVTLNAELRITGDLVIQPVATLDVGAGNRRIALGGDWANLGGTFEPRQGTVVFFGNAAVRQVLGDNDFYGFVAVIDDSGVAGVGPADTLINSDPGVVFRFEQQRTQTIRADGRFVIHGGGAGWDPPLLPPAAGPYITLDSTAADTNPANYWRVSFASSVNLDLRYVYIDRSEADPAVFTPDLAHASADTIGWIVQLEIVASITVDRSGTGKLDAIRLTANTAAPASLPGFRVFVRGYQVAEVAFSAGPAPEELDINLVEQPFLDTGARPLWRLETPSGDPLLPATNLETVGGVEYHRPQDGAPPVIGYTLAIPGGNRVYVHLSEPVPGAVFQYSGAPVATAAAPGGTADQDYILTPAGSVTVAQILGGADLVSVTGIDQAGLAFLPARNSHRVSDLLLVSPDFEVVTPVFAREFGIERDATRGGIGLIRDFDGSAFLQPREILLQLFADGAELTIADLRLFYDSAVSPTLVANGLWLPDFDETDFSGLVPYPNDGSQGPKAPDSVNVDGNLLDFLFSPDARIRSGVMLDFFPRVAAGPPPLYAARLFNPGSTTWFRNVRPFSFRISEVLRQRGSVSILNNVINPENGEKATLHYELPRAGTVSINVFNLAGDLVDVIHRGRQQAGEHSTTWGGTNRQGRIVARGIYFIRVRGPDIDEYRKVMVVK